MVDNGSPPPDVTSHGVTSPTDVQATVVEDRRATKAGGKASKEDHSVIRHVMAANVARRKRIVAYLIDFLVLGLLISIGFALLAHQRNLDANSNVYFESAGKSTSPNWVRDSMPVPPTFLLETIRLQKSIGILNPAAMIVKTKSLTTFTFNQTYETFPEVVKLVAATPNASCLVSLSGSGFSYCRMPAAEAIAALKTLDFIPQSLVARAEADVKANSDYKYLVFGGYGYVVQTEFSVVKLKDGNPDVAVSLSACIEGDDVQIINGYDQITTNECINYGNVKTFDLQFVSCTNATFASTLYEQVCFGLIAQYGRGMTFQGTMELHTGEVVRGMNGIMVARNAVSSSGLMLLPSSAIVSVEDIGYTERSSVSARGIGIRDGQIIGMSSTMNVFHYKGVSFILAAMLQMLAVILTLRWTRRLSTSMIDTLTIYNRLGSSVVVFGELVYSGHIINGVSYALARCTGFDKAAPVLVIEVCLYTINCLI